MSPEHYLYVAEHGEATSDPPSSNACTLGQDLKICFDDLQTISSSWLTSRDCDLLYVIGSIALADRKFRRHLSKKWQRRINICIPVHEPELWNSSLPDLLNLLTYVTGDKWNLLFRMATRPSGIQGALIPRVSKTRNVDSVIPFSGGLDSLAALLLAKGVALPVNTNANSSVAKLASSVLSGTSYADRLTHLKVAMSKAARGRHPEPTYRTRTLLFFVIAAIAARLVGAPQVIVGEAGQGSLGPSLVPFAGEHPYRASHPGTTHRLRIFLSRLWSDPPRFEHPFIWKTKGQVFSELISVDETRLWTLTKSCSRDRRKAGGLLGGTGCGVCGGCLLRQMSLHAVGISELHNYAIRELHTLPEHDADRQALVCSMLGLICLAELQDSTLQSPQLLLSTASELSSYLGLRKGTAQRHLRQLINTHATEWRCFLKEAKPISWITRMEHHEQPLCD